MAGKHFFQLKVQKGKIFSLEVFIFLQSDNFPLEYFSHPTYKFFESTVWNELYRMQDNIWHEFVPPLGEISEDCKWAWNVVAAFFHLLPISSSFCPRTLENCMPTTETTKLKKFFKIFLLENAFFSKKKILKLFKCYLHEIQAELFKKQAEKWANKKFILFSRIRMHFCPCKSAKFFFRIFKIVCHRKKHSQNVSERLKNLLRNEIKTNFLRDSFAALYSVLMYSQLGDVSI